VRLSYLPRRVRRVYSQQRNLQLPFESVCTESGIESSNANSTNRLPWNHLIRWKEGPALFVVYQSDLIFNIVPKRCFAEPDQVDAFRSLLTERLGPPV
ncbi:MAG TPA: YcxB family protein, partial [Gemmatimonadales bacterium]